MRVVHIVNDNDRARLDRLEEKIDGHGESIAAIKEQTTTIFWSIGEIKNKLLGNGQEGLCDVATRHKTYFKILGVALTIVGIALVGVICERLFGG